MENNTPQLKPAMYSLADEFGLTISREVQIQGFAAGHPDAPVIDPNYVFMPQKLREILAFWQLGLVALQIEGDPSTGKTSLITQFHARLRWPLCKVMCNPSTEACKLIGQLLPQTDGSFKWVDGPLVRAAKGGYSVLLDEGNTLDPGQATGLNILLEGGSFTIEETGELVVPQPGFRIFTTQNSSLARLSVSGRNLQDVAFDDRFMYVTADYLPPDLEIQAVFNALMKIGGIEGDHSKTQLLAEQLVGVANKVRAAYRSGDCGMVQSDTGDLVKRVAASDGPQWDGGIDKPMSTRAVIRWGLLFTRFRKVAASEGGPAVYALLRALKMNPDMQKSVTAIVHDALGTVQAHASP